MQIWVNGEPREVTDAITLAELVRALALPARRVAFEVNREVVPRSLHGGHRLHAGDRVEVVTAIGGG